MMTFAPIRVDDFSGYCQKSFHLEQNWHAIRAQIDGSRPIYSVNSHRKTFLVDVIPGTGVYVKVINENVDRKRFLIDRLLSSEARRYLRNYLLLKKYHIISPQVLFVLEEKRWLTTSKSIIATVNFQGFEPWPQFFASHPGESPFDEGKRRVLKEIAQFTARLHAAGIYFSLDGRNLYLRSVFGKPGGNIGISDLDHVRIGWLGKIPERRRMRNLRRFECTMLRTDGMSPPDYEFFMRRYYEYLEDGK
jgi:hypothetical protein